MFAAWREFRRGKRKKKDVATFELNLEDNIFELHRQLVVGLWRNDPYNIFRVNDPKPRIIHKASVRDRVLFQAIYRKMYYIFDRNFIFDSYASRLHKGTHTGVKRFEVFARKVTSNNTHSAFVLKCDVRKFFDCVDHAIILSLIAEKIFDQKLFTLIKQIVFSFAIDRGKGLPLGNVTSQLFANIYLNELDQFVKHVLKARYYIRYCDDFVILNTRGQILEAYIKRISNFLLNKLKLDLHPKKVSIRKLFLGTDFLGYVSLPHCRILRTRTKKRILKQLIKLANNVKTKEEFSSVSPIVQSYFGTLSHCKGLKIKNQIRKIFV